MWRGAEHDALLGLDGMGFRGSRVQIPPSRLNGEPRGSPFFVGPAGLCRRRSPAARGIPGQIPPSRLVGESALQRISLWGCFFLPHAVSNAVSFYRLTIRCVGCNTTFLIVSASACWYDVTSTSSVFHPPAAATSFTGYPFRSVARFRRIECHIPRRCGTIFATLNARRSQSSNR